MNTCSISNITFGKLLNRFLGNSDNFVSGMTMEITRRCNFACKHCYCCLEEQNKLGDKELSLEDWDRILDECAKLGVILITMTGGEPLIYKNFRELWILAKRKGFLINLFTNAALIDEETADFFTEWTPNLISVTLYGASEKTYKKVTGSVGNCKTVLNALELLSERKINLQVKGTFSHLNKDEFQQIKTISRQYCDIFCWGTDLVEPYIHGGMIPHSVRLNPKEIVDLEANDPDRWAEMVARAAVWKPMEKRLDSPFRCGIGKGLMHIDPYGFIHPCLQFDSIKCNILDKSVKECWFSEVPELLKAYVWEPGPCQSCDLADICLNCPAKAELNGTPPTGPSISYCEIGFERAKKLGLLDKITCAPIDVLKKINKI